MIELVHLQRQFQSIKDEIIPQIEAVIDSGHYILGPNVRLLEAEAAIYLGVKHAVGVANGTDALVLTLDACGIGPGDEVITTPFTFFASAEAISRVGAVPVFVDIDEQTYNLDVERLEEAITERTKAIIPVHLFGQPADMKEIMDIAKRHGLLVIEDACQAFGAEYHGMRAGSIGHAACFSFFPTKNLGTVGDGGLVTTNDDQLAERIRQLRHHGSKKKYYHERIGYNSRLDELHAAILRVCLRKLDGWNAERRRLAARYNERLSGHSHLHLPQEAKGRKHIYHLYCLESAKRDEMLRVLQQAGVQSAVYYPLPLHLQEAYRHLGSQWGDYPVAEQKSQRLFAVPLSPFLKEEEQDVVIRVLREAEGGPEH